tara:strand:+ start:309 stop:497 length:189 start_codon:yes stop_codon:yes gene_type:complete
MELKIGDLVSHRIHKDAIGYGIIISPSVPLKNITVCSVQWIESGYIHTMDIDMLEKITEDKK